MYRFLLFMIESFQYTRIFRCGMPPLIFTAFPPGSGPLSHVLLQSYEYHSQK